MTTTTREITKGAIGGIAFLVGLLLMGMPFLLAVGLGAAIYVGLGLLLPKAAAPEEGPAALGLSAAERNQFLGSCRRSKGELAELATQISDRGFRPQVEALAKVAAALIEYFEKNPESILIAAAVPQNLERLVGMLRQYATIRNYQAAGQTADEALHKVEDIVERAHASFEGMFQQLLENDLAALDTSAHTLAILLEPQPGAESPRRAQFSQPQSNDDRQSARTRVPQKEKPT